MKFDQGLSIQALERFVADRAMQEGYKPVKVKATQKAKVAVVGSGPAGLSCAYHLARLGYRTALFEAQRKLGGKLRFGIPEYRLPDKILEWEIKNITSLNIQVRVNQRLGTNLRFGDLNEFDALFISTGFQRSRELSIPGEGFPGRFILSGLFEKGEFRPTGCFAEKSCSHRRGQFCTRCGALCPASGGRACHSVPAIDRGDAGPAQ